MEHRDGILEPAPGCLHKLMGQRYLRDIMETMGAYVDSLKFSGGSFSLMPPDRVRELIQIAHEHDALVSPGGFIEYVLTQGKEEVTRYIQTCKDYGFDIIEISRLDYAAHG